MKDHLSQRQLDEYRQQRLQATELISVDDHLAVCADCRQRVEATLPGAVASLYADLRITAASLPDAGSAAMHLTSDQIAYYVDELLAGTEQQFVADHLASCARCARQADGLRAFRDELISQPSHVSTAAENAGEAGWWEKLRARFWPLSPAPAFGLALAALLLLGLAGWLIRLISDKKTSAPHLARQEASPTPAAQFTPTFSPQPSAAPADETNFVAQLKDGDGQVTLNRQGELKGLDNLPAEHQRMVKDALTARRLAMPSTLDGLNRRGSSLMGADEQGNQFSLLAPAGKVIFTDRPTFRWTLLGGAASYVVEIYDEQFTLVKKSEALQRTEWTPPQPLARGRVYAWQVKAMKDGQVVQAPKPPATQARFRVLAQPAAEEITRARRTSSSSHLTLGLLYAQAGLLDEAEQELRTLLKANPDSAIVRRWLAQVQAQRR